MNISFEIIVVLGLMVIVIYLIRALMKLQEIYMLLHGIFGVLCQLRTIGEVINIKLNKEKPDEERTTDGT